MELPTRSSMYFILSTTPTFDVKIVIPDKYRFVAPGIQMSSENSQEKTSADDAEEHGHVGIKVTSEPEDEVQVEERSEGDLVADEANGDAEEDLDIDGVEAVDDEDETKSGESSNDDEKDYVDSEDKTLLKKKSSFVYSFTSKKYRLVDADIDDFDDDELDSAEIVKATDSLEDSGVSFVRLHGGEQPEDTESFRGSLRDKDSSYDLIISEDQIRMTWATRNNHEWKVAHSKSIFPEHVTEMDYYKYDVKTNHGGCIAMCCHFRCPRIAYSLRCCRLACCRIRCCRVRCCTYERGTKKKLIAPAVVEPCVCQPPRCSLCSGLNPLTAVIHLGFVVWCFYFWYINMFLGKKKGLIVMTSAVKPMEYTTYYLLFLLVCEFITLFNLWRIERYTVQVAKEEEDEENNGEKELLLLKNQDKIKQGTKIRKTKKKKKASKKIKLPPKDPDIKKLKGLDKEIRKMEKRKSKALKMMKKKKSKPDTEKPETEDEESKADPVQVAEDLIKTLQEEKKETQLKIEKKLQELNMTNEEAELDDGIEPGAVRLSMKERNQKSIDAVRAISKRHKYAFYLTSCILLWHILFVLVLGVTTLGIPYDWEGKLKIKGVPDIPSRRLHHKPDEPIVNYCVEPNIVAQENAKFWCEETFYNMLYKNEKQGPPYWKCPPVIDCKVSEWSECSKPCGNGTQTRSIITGPSGGGKSCPGPETMKRFCNTKPCDCVLSDWGACSKSCAGGAQFKAIIQHPTTGGKPCLSLSERTRSCNTQPCKPEDCELTGWKKCNCATKKQTRSIAAQPRFNGETCDKVAEPEGYSKDCVDLDGACPKVDCKLKWSECDCNSKTQTRIKEQEEKNGGKTCDQVKAEDGEGNSKTCSCPKVDCEYGWKPCNVTCGGGVMKRYVAVQAKNGGKSCSVVGNNTATTKVCNTHSCLPDKIVPYWYCPVNNDVEPLDTEGHLHRAKYNCGHCHPRFMAPWISVMIALCIEFLLMCVVAVLTYERRRLGRFTKGRMRLRRRTKPKYEKGKRGKFKLGEFERPSMTRMPSFDRPSIKRSKYQPHEWVPGRFRYIKPTIMSLGKFVITDRARRKHTLYLTRDKIMEARAAFFKVQNQKLRKEWTSHSNNPW